MGWLGNPLLRPGAEVAYYEDNSSSLTPAEETESITGEFPWKPRQDFISKSVSTRIFHEAGGLEGLERQLHTNRRFGISLDEPFNEASFTGAPSHSTPYARACETGGHEDVLLDRQRVYGNNRLPTMRPRIPLTTTFYSWKGVIVVSLAALRCLVPDHSVVIISAICIVLLFELAIRRHNDRLFRALEMRRRPMSGRVIRSGKVMEIPVDDIVVGDVVLLESGDLVPADGIFIDGHGIRVDESSVTGEGDLLRKHPTNGKEASTTLEYATQIYDPVILSGSRVLEGVGSFLVTSTGVHSAYGMIINAAAMDSHEDSYDPDLALICGLKLLLALFLAFCPSALKVTGIETLDIPTWVERATVDAIVNVVVLSAKVPVLRHPIQLKSLCKGTYAPKAIRIFLIVATYTISSILAVTAMPVVPTVLLVLIKAPGSNLQITDAHLDRVFNAFFLILDCIFSGIMLFKEAMPLLEVPECLTTMPNILSRRQSGRTTGQIPPASPNLQARRFEVKGTLNDTCVTATADTGASYNLISEKLARSMDLKPIPGTRGNILLPTGRKVLCRGQVQLQFQFAEESEDHSLTCAILPGATSDVILGANFLRTTRTFTSHAHRLEKVFSSVGVHLLNLVGGEQDFLRGYVNGLKCLAVPDTGSDIMAISRAYARKLRLKIHKTPRHRSRIRFVDGSEALTDGIARATWQFRCGEAPVQFDFHVLRGLPVNVILSNAMIDEFKVMSRFQDHIGPLKHPGHDGWETSAMGVFGISLVERCKGEIRSLSESFVEDITSDPLFTPEKVERERARRDEIRDRIEKIPDQNVQAEEQAKEDARKERWDDLWKLHRQENESTGSSAPSQSSATHSPSNPHHESPDGSRCVRVTLVEVTVDDSDSVSNGVGHGAQSARRARFGLRSLRNVLPSF